MPDQVFFLGVDVGSGSARAALVDPQGHIIKTAIKELKIWKRGSKYYEQSSENIWKCCQDAIKDVVKNVNPNTVKGIGFDATCSLVALDKNGNAKSVSDCGRNEKNVIMWMDHRAQAEADFINETKHEVLKYVGGKVSLEMQMPKLLWLKRRLPDEWNEYGYFFDLPDYLTFRATGEKSRSLCSLLLKWNYVLTEKTKGWNLSFLEAIGLKDLADCNFEKIGAKVLVPGLYCGGLTEDTAEAFGLQPGTPVSTSIIDAHAGGLGMIGTNSKDVYLEMWRRLSLICGTSTCHIALKKQPTFVEGVWEPYFDAMVPGLWMNEGGQSASGMLLDHVISSHPAAPELLKKYSTGEVRFHLRKLLQDMTKQQKLQDVNFLTKNFHICPDFHGNRSPFADPNVRGMIVGLTISSSENNLALVYLATLQALCYGTRHIIETLVSAGYEPFEYLSICGGLSQDPLFVQIQADSVGVQILQPAEKESVLVGSAILGACAATYYGDIMEALQNMGGVAEIICPNTNLKSFHNKKYQVFLKMYQDQLKYKAIMEK